jgi:hypothetical protein
MGQGRTVIANLAALLYESGTDADLQGILRRLLDVDCSRQSLELASTICEEKGFSDLKSRICELLPTVPSAVVQN